MTKPTAPADLPPHGARLEARRARHTASADTVSLGNADDGAVVARFFRALGDSTRLQLLGLLLDAGEMTVSELVDAVGKQQGRVSSHLACLRWCGLAASRQQGRQVYYSIPDDRVADLLRLALPIVADNAEHIRQCHRIGL